MRERGSPIDPRLRPLCRIAPSSRRRLTTGCVMLAVEEVSALQAPFHLSSWAHEMRHLPATGGAKVYALSHVVQVGKRRCVRCFPAFSLRFLCRRDPSRRCPGTRMQLATVDSRGWPVLTPSAAQLGAPLPPWSHSTRVHVRDNGPVPRASLNARGARFARTDCTCCRLRLRLRLSLLARS